MQNKITLIIILAAFFILRQVHSHGTIRFTLVDPVTHTMKIKNFQEDDAVLDISELSVTVTNGERVLLSDLTVDPDSLKLGQNEEATITGFELPFEQGGLTLYKSETTDDNATDPDKMSDFVQWGAEGLGREDVADEKGIWTAGDFLSGSAIFNFTGASGADNGLEFWEATVNRKDLRVEKAGFLLFNSSPTDLSIRPGSKNSQEFFDIYMYGINGELIHQFRSIGIFRLKRSMLHPSVSIIRAVQADDSDNAWNLYNKN